MIMADDLSLEIFDVIKEIQGSNDPEVFVKKLLRDTLNWPIEIDDLEEFDFDDLGYDWNSELETMGLRSDEGIQELFQIAKFPGWPLGMFVVRFGSNSIFTKGRGMTTPLRNLLRNLVEKVRPTASHQTWSQDQLLFMCHYDHTHYEFARFTNMGEKTLPKLQSFGWGPNDGDAIHTLCTENLPYLKYDQSISQEDNFQNITKAFDVQKVSSKFYSDYKSSFANFKSELLEHADYDDNDEIHRYVQLVFNRFLFLRFIEKKGWLRFGHDGNFLRNLYDSFIDSGKAFYKDGFLPMALEGLVEPGKQKSEIYGEVELIGGGLFETSIFDSKFSNLPNEMFSPIIGENGLLYRYNFTIQESTPLDVQVAIDPEMIGTMFEELVTDRDGKGAFYTPRVVVSYMCKESIKSTLQDKTDVDKEKIIQLVDFENNTLISIQDAKKIREVLDGIKAIDPACGSGAYLLGLLQEIIKIHENLQTLSSEFDRSKYDLKLHIISRSIFGADLDPFATQIAMVRLWLSLAVESEEPVQLPNLDFNIETGDALLAPDPSQENWFMSSLYQQADELAEKKEMYLVATENISEIRKEIKLEEASIRAKLRSEMDYPGSVDFRIHFAGVFSKNGGFDIVLANPPYVRSEEIRFHEEKKIHELRKKDILKRYKSCTGKSDLYCYFYERSLQLLNSNGIQSIICSNTWLDNKMGKSLRNYICSTSSVKLILESEIEKQFSTAEVNTIISLISKNPNKYHSTDFITVCEPFAHGSISPEGIRKRTLRFEDLKKYELEEKTDFGIKWGASFLRPKNKHDEFILATKNSLKRPKSFLRGSSYLNTGGADAFFIISNYDETDDGIHFSSKVKIDKIEHNYSGFMEKSMLTPLIKNVTKGSKKLFIDKTDSFCFTPKGDLSDNARKYIKWGEEMNFNKKPSLKNKLNWYKPQRDMLIGSTLIAPRTFSDRYNIYFNQNKNSSLRFYRLELIEAEDYERYLPFFYSCFFYYFMELRGNKGLGGGALDFYITDMIEWKMPIPLVSDETFSLFKSAIKEDFGNIRLEYSNPASIPKNRNSLDFAIANELGLTEEWVKWVRKETLSMMSNRFDKAKSNPN
jgi:hypothetical protein